MASISPEDEPALNIREQIARIDKMQGELQKIMAELVHDEQTTRFAPWQLAFAGLGAGAGLVAATVALTKILLG